MRILIADDEVDIRNLIKTSLEESGYTVFAAQNGREAWEIISKQQVDLAILDVMMPVMDGFLCSGGSGTQRNACHPPDCPHR